MTAHGDRGGIRALPGDTLPQVVPSDLCLRCDVCCRFPERESFLRPYFTAQERERAIAAGLAPELLPDLTGGKIRLIPHPGGEGYLCPAFDPATQHCGIYAARPLDCRLYPLALMRDEEGRGQVLGLDTKCPYVQDAAHEPRLMTYAREVGTLLREPAVSATLAANTDLFNAYQDDVRPLGPIACSSREPLLLTDRPWVESLLGATPSESGSRTFTGVYLWREHFTYAWTWLHGYWCLFASYGPHLYMPWPPLAGPESDPARWRTALGAAFDVMASAEDHGASARIEGVDEREVGSFVNAGYEVIPHSVEYVYRRDDLVALRGNSYKSKRWAWNDFTKQGVFTLDPLRDDHVEGCLSLYRHWRTHKARRGADSFALAMAEDAESAHRVALTERRALGLSGLVVTIDGRVAGYTVGGTVGPSLFGVWLEITDPAHRGLSVYLFREFCRAQTGVEWITAFDDSGLESLARAKQAYRPARLVTSHLVRRPVPSALRSSPSRS